MIKIIQGESRVREEIFSGKEEKKDVSAVVSEIIERVKTQGDAALYYYTEKFDKAKLTTLKVSAEEIAEAAQAIEPRF